MTADSISLARLHDLVIPPSVPLLPPAPGWYLVSVLLGSAMIWLSWRYWKQWRANTYRREALRQLQQLQDTPAIAELLRRTALAVVPRSEIAVKTGSDWADWLAGHCREAMAPEVKNLLSSGIYSRAGAEQDVRLLRTYAARWISHHFIPDKNNPGTLGE